MNEKIYFWTQNEEISVNATRSHTIERKNKKLDDLLSSENKYHCNYIFNYEHTESENCALALLKPKKMIAIHLSIQQMSCFLEIEF
jgi:hypothetical protein